MDFIKGIGRGTFNNRVRFITDTFGEGPDDIN